MKKETKQKIKNKLSKLKKPLMILSIVFNILFGLALIIGLSSNNKKTQCLTAEDTGTIVYTFNENIDNMFYNNSDYQPGWFNVTFTTQYNSTTYYRLGKNGIVLSYTNVASNPSGSNNISAYRYAVSNPWVQQGYRYLTITGGTDLMSSDFRDFLSLWGNVTSDTTGYVDPNSPIPPTPVVDDTQNLIFFGDNFNPITYITHDGDYIYNGFGGKASNENGYFVLNLTGLTFISNGETFNTIKFFYFNLPPIVTEDGSTYIDNSGDLSTQYMYCAYIQYLNIENESTLSNIIVCSPRRTIINDNGSNIKAFDVRPPFYIWINDEYRTIQIIENNNTIISDEMLTIQNKTAYQLLQVRNSSTQSVMGLTNVFGLMKGAFNGITDILAISILPGITLGLLLFIPLIVTIIIAVVRLIKK